MVKLIKVNDDLVRLVNGIKIRCLKEGKPVPSTNVITSIVPQLTSKLIGQSILPPSGSGKGKPFGSSPDVLRNYGFGYVYASGKRRYSYSPDVAARLWGEKASSKERAKLLRKGRTFGTQEARKLVG